MDGVTYLTNLFDNRFRAPTMNSPFDYGIARSLRNARVRVTHAKVTPRSDLWPYWSSVTNITEHRTYEGKVYRAVVLDTFSRRSNQRGTYDVRPRGIGLATGGLGLVIDDGKSAALEVRQTISHGLKLFGRVPYPVRDLADYFHGLPGAVRTGRISRKPFVRHIGVVLQFAFRFHDVDTTRALAQSQLSPPRGGIQCLRHINVVRVASFAVVRLAPGNK